MRQSILFAGALLGLALLTLGFQCHKDDYVDPPIEYQFAEKLTLTPYKKVYAIDDTIWVQFQTSDTRLFDQLSNTRIAVDTASLQVGFNYHKHYIIGTTEEFFADIKVENVLDTSFRTQYPWYNVLKFQTGCTNNSFHFRIGFIPKKKGIYALEPGAEVAYCPDKKVRPFSSFGFTFDLADCNKDVWLSIPYASRGGQTGYTDVRIDKKQIFIFKVE